MRKKGGEGALTSSTAPGQQSLKDVHLLSGGGGEEEEQALRCGMGEKGKKKKKNDIQVIAETSLLWDCKTTISDANQ